MKKKQRIFIAINLPKDIRKYLANFQKKWPELPAKWTNPENLHITLVFLGYITDIELGKVCMAVKEVVKRHNAFDINLNKIAYGPNGEKSPRMVWTNGNKSKELFILKKDLENSLSESIGFRPETRTFNSHITLARLKQMEFRAIEPEERPEINENIDLTLTVESIEVMESMLKRSGPEYTIIESFPLSL